MHVGKSTRAHPSFQVSKSMPKVQRPKMEEAAMEYNLMYPSSLTLRAGVLLAPPFAMWNGGSTSMEGSATGFSLDLLDRLKIFAQADGVALHFNLSEAPSQYGPALDLVANDCAQAAADTTDCDKFDLIVGDYYCNPDRSVRVDFTPAWLRTTMATLKYIGSNNDNDNDRDDNERNFETMAQLEGAGGTACVPEGAYLYTVAMKRFPKAHYYQCPDPLDCIAKLKSSDCQLYVDDELLLRYRALSDPTVEVNRDSFNTQYLVYPMRYDLDPTASLLMKRWMYAAIANATLDDLYHDYFAVRLCPVGQAGPNCELPCDPKHGESDRDGVCVCESTKWTGPDCSVEVMEDVNLIPTGLKITGYVMFGTAALAIVACMIWLFIERNKPQVKNRQPPLLGLVLLGCLISTSGILALAQESAGDGPVNACMVTPWLYSVGFCVTFATLSAKMWRIKKLFDGAARMQRIAVTAHHAMTKVGAILFIDIIILAVWTAVDPLQWTREVLLTDKYGDPLSSQGYCISDHFAIFASPLAVLHFGILAVGSYYCYLSWLIPTQFSEGKFVGVAILANLQVFLIGIPILLIVGIDADSSFFVQTAIIWINNITVVGFVFGNLIYATHNDKVVVMTTRTAIKSFVERQQSYNSSTDRNRSSQFSHRYHGDDDAKHHPDDWTNDLITAAAKGDMDKLCLLLEETVVDLSADHVDVHSRANINAGETGQLERVE